MLGEDVVEVRMLVSESLGKDGEGAGHVAIGAEVEVQRHDGRIV